MCLLIAMAIAAVTRLGWLGLVQFEYDESWALTVASSIAHGQSFPLVGIGSSLDIPNAPFFVYLMALPELVSRDPALATGLIGLLSTTAVAATYGFARSLFGPIAAAAAALLYAVSPWGIVYSRKIWGQDALPIFVTLGFWALFASLLHGQRSLIAPGVVLLTLATQLHPTAYFLAVPAAVLVTSAVVDSRQTWRTVHWLGVGLIAAAAIEAPFIVWQAQNGWPFLDAVRRLARDPGQLDLSALRSAGSAVAGSGYPLFAQVTNLWAPGAFVEGALLLGGISVLGLRSLRSGPAAPRLAAFALLAWLAVPVLAQTHHSVPIYPHYFIVLYPAAYIVMGVAVEALEIGSRGLGASRWLAVGVVALPVVLGIAAFGEYVVALGAGATRPDFGVPLARQEALFDAANDLANGGPVYFGAHDPLAPTLGYLGDGRWRIFDDRLGLRLPASDRVSVLVIDDPTSTAGKLAGRLLGAERATTLTLADHSRVTLYRLAPEIAEAAPGYRALDVAFENGMTLSGYRVARDPAGQKLLIDLHWRFAGLPPAKSPTVFNHLVDQRGETVAGVDGLAYDPTDWRPGEVGLDEFDLSWPTAPGPYRLQVGLYDYPSMQRFRILRPADGAPVDSVDLGTVNLANGKAAF